MASDPRIIDPLLRRGRQNHIRLRLSAGEKFNSLLNVYHKMLRGAVTFGEDFEEHYMKQIFELDKGMTQAISHFSRYEDAGRILSDTGKYIYTGNKKVTAEDKIRSFYKNTIRFLWIGTFSLLIITNASPLSKLFIKLASDNSPQPTVKTDSASPPIPNKKSE